MVMNVDLETYSSTDIKAGVYRYVEDPDFRVLLIGYRIDDGPVRVIDLTYVSSYVIEETGVRVYSEDYEDDQMRTYLDWYMEFFLALTSKDVVKTAFNASFERTCLAKHFKREMPPEEWDDTMIRAAMVGLPRSLAAVGAALGLPEDKQKDKVGRQLITYFCKPCRPTKANGERTRNLPEHDREKWDLFMEYNRQDVVAEAAIRDRLVVYPVPEQEHRLWAIDQRMNDGGIRIDMDLVHAVIDGSEAHTERLTEEARELTGLDNPNSVAQLKGWLSDRLGRPIGSLTKDTMGPIREELTDPDALRVLDIRAELGKTSVKKYQAMVDSVCEDDRLRGLFRFYGAGRTGRWAGAIVQPQNLARNSLPDLDLARRLVRARDFETTELLFGGLNTVFSELVRTAFIPSDGCRFVVSDYSAIEARVIAWLAGEKWRMDVFANGGDIYCASASQMFHVPVVKHGENGHLRQKGKIAELALGYGGGVGAMKAMDKAGSIPEEELPGIVEKWRIASPKICRLWRICDTAAQTAITERRSVKTKGLVFSYRDGILFIRLPSGRKIAYYGARAEQEEGKDALSYMGVDQTTNQWTRIETWGGKLVENIVQAIARDCLAVTMERVTAAGYRIQMHVHDEIIVDVPRTDADALKTICDIMAEPVPWAPGLLLRGDGYETDYYKKD